MTISATHLHIQRMLIKQARQKVDEVKRTQAYWDAKSPAEREAKQTRAEDMAGMNDKEKRAYLREVGAPCLAYDGRVIFEDLEPLGYKSLKNRWSEIPPAEDLGPFDSAKAQREFRDHVTGHLHAPELAQAPVASN
jgi:hypothetical protein